MKGKCKEEKGGLKPEEEGGGGIVSSRMSELLGLLGLPASFVGLPLAPTTTTTSTARCLPV